jgi:hypothetical protein
MAGNSSSQAVAIDTQFNAAMDGSIVGVLTKVCTGVQGRLSVFL